MDHRLPFGIPLIVALLFVSICSAVDRVHYIAVVQEEWDFAPEGNLMWSDSKESDLYLKRNASVPTIGSKYIKAMYREFTDDTFTQRVKRPAWLGFLGPFLHAEIGDRLIIHFFNNASGHNYSMHPHGVLYDKDSEGALYVDRTSGADKNDDHVPPGGKHTYTWTINEEYGPTIYDPECITWVVHSHQFAEEEVNTGALLIMATCKTGALDQYGRRRNVDREYALLLMISDENVNNYIDETVAKFLPVDGIEDTIAANLNTYQTSNKKPTINGLMYGNLKGLKACKGDRVSFHIAVIGSDEDVHSVSIQGHTMRIYEHSQATNGYYPGSSYTALVTADNPGQWLVSSRNVIYERDGMVALFKVNPNCGHRRHRKYYSSGITRTYYIAAEEVTWSYAPSGYDLVSGKPLSETRIINESFGESTSENCKLNGIYKKAIFRGYTDSRFETKTPRPDPDHLGILGPPIKAEVGDTVRVIFRNKASRNYSIQTYRYFVDYDENGVKYDGGPDVDVPPGETKVYIWRVPPNVGPLRNDPDCLLGRYYSAVKGVEDTFSGLSGPIVICRRNTLDSNGKYIKADKEFYLMFSAIQERYSNYIVENIQQSCPDFNVEERLNNGTFAYNNIMRSLNGRIYGNLEGLHMCENDVVIWYVMSVGSGMDDLHAPQFFGNIFEGVEGPKDSISLVADTFATLRMVASNPGIWLLEDQVTLYFDNIVQMKFLYEVDPSCQTKDTDMEEYSGKIRTYYIAAVEVDWDYAPRNIHIITGEKLSENRVSRLYYNNEPDRNWIGHIYRKALYREFTDDTFTEEKVRSFRESHLGMQGPFIKAEVGDTIRVVFKNLATNFSFSINPHSVLYDKADEGLLYNDSFPNKGGAEVAPGETFTYTWYVPESAGPREEDFNCITSAYTSHVDFARDVNTGLVGPLLLCKNGILNDEGQRMDVDDEFSLLFLIENEGGSAYADYNIRKYLNKEPTQLLKNDLSNAMLGINGWIFGNVPNVTAMLDDTIAWSIISLGDTTSTHTVHWHGNTIIRNYNGYHRHDVLDVLPGSFETVEMHVVNKGTWLMHCHVNNHSENGMDMVYTVLDQNDVYYPE